MSRVVMQSPDNTPDITRLGWFLRRLPVTLAIGGIGGYAFARWMRWDAPNATFTLGDEVPIYRAIEQAIGAQLAFDLLCAASFAGVAVVAVVVMWRLWRAMIDKARRDGLVGEQEIS